MFINAGGFPDHPGNGELHTQPKRHHHGNKHPQQCGQHYRPGWKGRLAARRHRLLPDPRRHGSLCPSALLLKARTPQGPPTPPPLLGINTPPHLIIPPTPASLLSSSPHRTGTTRPTWMDSKIFFFGPPLP
uniref:Uncharacterized protein n=1 Tax=Gasterosteus aculeatus TaxID=69293 RepID=G3P4R0_GASAC